MRRRGPKGALLGLVMVLLGAMILAAMLLPPGFWWFFIGLGLLICGFSCCRR